MAQTAADQERKQLNDTRKSLGRVNWGEYSKLTGTPIPKNAGPEKSYKPTPAMLKARSNAKRFGRVNASEYKALMARRKAKPTTRKRVSAK